MLQFTITGVFPEGDALEVALAWGYQEQITVEVPPTEPEGEVAYDNIPNPITPEQFVLNTMENDCATKIAEVYRVKAYRAKEALFLTEIQSQNTAIYNNVKQSITSEVVQVNP